MEFMEDDRPIDPALFIGPQAELLTESTFMALLSTHYWWRDDYVQPQMYLENLLGTLNEEQLDAVTNMLHTDLEYCKFDADNCTGSAKGCIENEIKSRHLDPATLSSIDYRRWVIHGWADGLLSVDESDADYDDEPNVLKQAYEKYVIQSLGAAGLTDIEVDNAIRVLQVEEDRREISGSPEQIAYDTYRDIGNSHDNFLNHELVKMGVEDEGFKYVVSRYDDLSEDVMNWPMDRKRALVKRCIVENRDIYDHLAYSYSFRKLGTLPPYVHQFSNW